MTRGHEGAGDRPEVRSFVPPGHFYSPVVDPAIAVPHLDALARLPVPEGLPGIPLDRATVAAEWDALVPFLGDVPFPADPSPGFRYAFANPAYSWADGSVLYAMLRRHRPRRLIEVGGGWSSACAIDTIERHLDAACAVTCIDPFPALLRELVGATRCPLEIIEAPVQAVPLTRFDALAAGDVLFIDSTHVLKTGSDVCCLLFDVLPRLAPGVLVHLHDMFWPFEYPRAWVVDENRSWNELYAVRAFLTGTRDWEVLVFNDYLRQVEPARVKAAYPAFFHNSGGALWMRRR